MRRNIQELTGLRGVAALLILIGHSVIVAPVIKESAVSALFNVLTYCGMSIFFILSGIVICYNYLESVVDEPRRGIPKFFLARFARLYPLYILVVLGSFAFDCLVNVYHGTPFSPDTAAECSVLPIYLVGMQSWFYGFIGGKQFVYLMGPGSITWSVSTEFALYFLFVVVAFLIRRRRSSGARLVVLGTLLYLGWFCFVQYTPYLTGFADRLYPGHSGEATVFFTYRFPLPRFFEFLVGCGIAMFYKSDYNQTAGRSIRISVLAGVVVSLLVLALLSAEIIDFDGCRLLLVSPCVSLLILGVYMFGSRLLQTKPLAFMGDVSYSTYLIHPFIDVFISYFGYQASHAVPNLLAHFGVTYLLAYFVYNRYEVPMRRKIRGSFWVKHAYYTARVNHSFGRVNEESFNFWCF